MQRRTTALTAAALSLLPLGQPLLLGTLGIATATTAVFLHQGAAIAQDASAVARIAKAITVRIEGSTQGSGVIVKREGNRYTVLTAWHVVSDSGPGEEVGIYTPDGKDHLLEQGSVQRLGQVDMAVLTFSSPGAYEVASVGDVKSVSMGNQIFVSGFPLPTSAVPSRLMRFEDGMVKANATVAIPDGYQLLYSNQTLPGMSGGSVLNIQGQLVGIHGRSERDDQMSMSTGKAVSTGTNQAVPISYYRQFNTGQTVIAANTQATSADDYLVQAQAILGKQGREREVIRLTSQSLAIQQSDIAYSQRAWTKNVLRDYQGAIADYTMAIEINPLLAYAYSNRSAAKIQLKDFQGAFVDANKAIAISPQIADAYANKGIAINPMIADAYSNRGLAKQGLRDYQGATTDYNMAIQANPLNANAYSLRGVIKVILNDYQGSISDFDKAITINPLFADAYINRSVTRVKLQDYRGGISDLSKVIAIKPQFAVAYANRGSIKQVLGDAKGACVDLKKAVSLGDQQATQWLNSQGGAWCRNMR